MNQIILENLSRRQIFLFALVLFLVMVAFFVVGGTKGADPASANIHITNMFNGTKSFDSDSRWVWYNVHNVHGIDGLYEDKILKLDDSPKVDVNDLVFSTKIPHPGDGIVMHRANQFMLVIMNVQMDFVPEGEYHKGKQFDFKIDCDMTFDAKLGYSDLMKPNSSEDWTLMKRVKDQKRRLQCHFTSYGRNVGDDKDHGYYTCQDQHFFELGSVTHKHYLVNVLFPSFGTNTHCLANYTYFLSGLHFVELHQNGGYTISLFVSKTVMFPFIIGALVFFVSRVRREHREWLLLEKATMCLGMALSLLLFPIDWFTLVLDMPYMLFFSDLRQGLFYAALLIYWCLFAGEHILDQIKRNSLASYKYEVGSITIGCVCLFLFDTAERGVQLANPFHTIWKRDAGEVVAKAFIAIATVAVIIYCLFFIRVLYYVRKNINLKSEALPAMQEDRRLFYENKIFRFRALLYTTLFTVFVTIVCFILDQMNETTWKFEEGRMNDLLLVSSAMHFGVFGLWGTYVFAVLILYSPDSKPPSATVNYQRSDYLLRAGADTHDSDDEVSILAPKRL